MIRKIWVWAPRVICLCPGIKALSEHFTASGGYLYHLQHILLPQSFEAVGPNNKSKFVQDKIGCWWTRDSRTVLTFFCWHFCIFLFVERCFWLAAPALYHSAHHASITTLCKVQIFTERCLWFIMIYVASAELLCVNCEPVMWWKVCFHQIGLSIIDADDEKGDLFCIFGAQKKLNLIKTLLF